jgi:SAM-dependent methyltransferase
MNAINDRDTDRDWIRIGEDNPYWGVLSHDRFDRFRITAQDIESLYESGERDVEGLVNQAAGMLGGWPTIGAALDFGCGVGRLTHAMVRWASRVIGCDVSPGMLEIARKRFADRPELSFVEGIPEGPFDWINSYIVFQHIPPDRGLAILDHLLRRLAPEGIVTLHFTLYREPHLTPPPPRVRTGLVAGLRALVRPRQEETAQVGAIHMYDYPMDAILQRLTACGVNRTMLINTNHAGHCGAHIVGRREGGATTGG